jgi:hypothetical protein
VAFIPLDVLQDEAGLMLGGQVTELIIRQKNADDTRLPGHSESAPVIKAALEKELGAPPAAGTGCLWLGRVRGGLFRRRRRG